MCAGVVVVIVVVDLYCCCCCCLRNVIRVGSRKQRRLLGGIGKTTMWATLASFALPGTT